MNSVFKILMIIVGCVVAYFLMSLATNSQKMVQGISSQGKDLKAVTDLNQKIQGLEQRLTVLDGSLKASDSKIAENSQAITKIETVDEKISAVNLSISELKQKSTVTDSGKYASSKVEVDVEHLNSLIQELKAENQSIKSDLKDKDALITDLESQIKQNDVLLQTLTSSGSKDMGKKLELLLASASEMGADAYRNMEKQVAGLLVKVDGMKEVLGAYKEASIDKIQSLNNDLRTQLSSLDKMFEDNKAYSQKMLVSVQKEVSRLEADLDAVVKDMEQLKQSTADNVAAARSWVDGRIKDVAKQYDEKAAPQINITVSKLTEKMSVEIESVKKEFEQLEKRVSSLMSEKNTQPENEEAVGIVVTKSFEKSLVMINTPKGTYIFNPYADFTGVVRVRDADGNEQMVLVPYTGEYKRIGDNIIDTGPFSRSCALGINCNIDVRGSSNVPVMK